MGSSSWSCQKKLVGLNRAWKNRADEEESKGQSLTKELHKPRDRSKTMQKEVKGQEAKRYVCGKALPQSNTNKMWNKATLELPRGLWVLD